MSRGLGDVYKRQEMNALLIDIRTREEYDRSHWKGALSMPMDITDSYESELDASQSVKINFTATPDNK